jgi:hypothetical protein
MQDEPKEKVCLKRRMSMKGDGTSTLGIENQHAKNGERLSPQQMRTFPEATDEVQFEAADRGEVYGSAERTLYQ